MAANSTWNTSLDLGAVTYLWKAEGREHLIAAIHAAHTGKPYLAFR